MSAVYSTLKRRRSLSLTDTTSCKKTCTSVENFVLKPANEPTLRKRSALATQLQDAMEVDEGQYSALVAPLRAIAHRILDVDFTLEKQSKAQWAAFMAEACKQQTLWLSKYEDAWPIRTYMSRFLYARASQKRNLIAPIDLSFSHDRRGRCSVTEQSYVPRPTNVDALNDDSTTSLKDLLEAMHIGEPEFMAMQSLLRRLADKYLDTSAPLSIQERGRKDALVREAKDSQPLFSTKYEGAWPIWVCLERYLKGTKAYNKERASLYVRDLPAGEVTVSPSNEVPDSAELVHVDRPLAANLRGLSNALAAASAQNLILSVPAQSGANNENVPPKPASPVLVGGSKDSIPISRLPPFTTAPNQSSDPSRPVKEFLRSLDYNLDVLFDEFVHAGIKNDATLMIFKKLSDKDKEQFMDDMRLDRLQKFVLRKCLKMM